jgi:hypothetical protein
MSKKIEIKSGDKYGRLTILKEIEPHIQPSGQIKRKFTCLCECGNITNVQLRCLRSDNTKSCGCYRTEKNTKHGLRYSSIYKTWIGIKHRCYNTDFIRYNDWGGRGIRVCDRWLNSFENFYNDMGEKPRGTSIDRINNDGNYEPSNCRWATPSEQAINRRQKKYHGEEDINEQ